MRNGVPVLYGADGRVLPPSKVRRNLRRRPQAQALFSGFKGANDENLMDWANLPLEINQMLRNDLPKLRSRCRDLARNDDTTRRFLGLMRQNVIGHAGIGLQAKNRRGKTLDTKWNEAIETGWKSFGAKRRRSGQWESPSVCGQMSLREVAWLAFWSMLIDGECFVQILHGYPHNRDKFAVRFINPDLADSNYETELDNGHRIEMGVELDEFNRPVAYHFNKQHQRGVHKSGGQQRERIPANQMLHLFQKEHIGQLRGIPALAAVLHKTKMLNGVHEAIVVGWRVAAAKMGFLVPEDDADEYDTGEQDEFGDNVLDASPGSFETLQKKYDLKLFDPDYPTSTYESGNAVFMRQLANGLNISSPTLANDYTQVTYSSLRQAILEDRETFRCWQAFLIDGFYQPLFDEWYDWATNITQTVSIAASKRGIEPKIIWRPRGWAWVDPQKEYSAYSQAVNDNLRTRQSIISETSGADFTDVANELQEEEEILRERNLPVRQTDTVTNEQ